MPIATARLGREKTIKSLAARLFVAEGPDNAEARRRAERALLRANPSLANREAFVAGRVIIVPANTGLKTTDRVAITRPDLNGALDETTLRLQLSQGDLSEKFAKRTETIALNTARLTDPKLRNVVEKSLPNALASIDRARENLAKTEATITQRQDQFEKGFAAALAAVDVLKRKLPDPPK